LFPALLGQSTSFWNLFAGGNMTLKSTEPSGAGTGMPPCASRANIRRVEGTVSCWKMKQQTDEAGTLTLGRTESHYCQACMTF